MTSFWWIEQWRSKGIQLCTPGQGLAKYDPQAGCQFYNSFIRTYHAHLFLYCTWLFYTTINLVSSCTTVYMEYEPKIFIICSFKKKFVSPELDYKKHFWVLLAIDNLLSGNPVALSWGCWGQTHVTRNQGLLQTTMWLNNLGSIPLASVKSSHGHIPGQ